MLKAGVVRDDQQDGLQWDPVAELFISFFIEKARRGRKLVQVRGEPFEPLIYYAQKDAFVQAKVGRADRVNRQEDLEKWTLFDLSENAHFLNGRKAGAGKTLVEECIAAVKSLFRGRTPATATPPVPGRLVTTIGRALHEGAKIADTRWKDLWNGNSKVSGRSVREEIELKMRVVVGQELGSDFVWVSSNDPDPELSSDLMFVVEGLGGQRNLESGLPFYCVSLSAARVVDRKHCLTQPLAAGIVAPNVSQVYIGIPGQGGGAALLDERLSVVHRLRGQGRRPNQKLTIGVHHSRRRIDRALVFVDRLSRAMPGSVDKIIAIAAGGFNLGLTSAGGLAAYYEPTMSAISAYAGAILVTAATGREDAVTGPDGVPWFKGNPLKKEGILAWSDRGLRKEIESKVLEICGTLPP